MLKRQAGDLLRHARWAKGLTITQLSDRADVAPNTIVKIEQGNRNVLGLKVYALADVLDLDPSELFEQEEAVS